MQKADYSNIARFYDKGRSLKKRHAELWLELLSEKSGASEGAKLLDLGCGTGRFALPIALNLKYEVTGVDSSAEMIDVAINKDRNYQVNWIVEDAAKISFPDDSFDIVFISFLFHHVDSALDVIKQCARVLKPNGTIFIRYCTMDQIRDDVEHVFFPETIPIDEARMLTLEQMEGWLAETGFSEIESQSVDQPTHHDSFERLKGVREKFTSTLTLITDDEYERGLKKLADYVYKKPDDEWLLSDQIMLTTGKKLTQI